jgi:hypothetical protein
MLVSQPRSTEQCGSLGTFSYSIGTIEAQRAKEVPVFSPALSQSSLESTGEPAFPHVFCLASSASTLSRQVITTRLGISRLQKGSYTTQESYLVSLRFS